MADDLLDFEILEMCEHEELDVVLVLDQEFDLLNF